MQLIEDTYLLQHVLKFEDGHPLAPDLQNTDLEKASDEKLLELIKEGTRSQRKAAFSAIYARYYLDVWHFIKSKVFSTTEAKDIFSEVWAIAVEKFPEFEWQGKPFKPWLITTANNKVFEHIRRSKVDEENCTPLNDEIQAKALQMIDAELQLDKAAPVETPSDEIRNKADRLLLHATAKLKPIPRKIIRLTYFKGKNSTEIAQILDMKPGTVRQNHRRALIELQKFLSKEGQ